MYSRWQYHVFTLRELNSIRIFMFSRLLHIGTVNDHGTRQKTCKFEKEMYANFCAKK